MKFLKSTFGLLNKFELILWAVSLVVVILSYVLSGTNDLLTLMASAIGVTSLIFLAKGFCIGQVLIIIFSVFYGIISFRNQYYGEMITYLGMTMPMAVFALISWLRNPYHGNKAEVKVNSIGKRENVYMWIGTFIITVLFYFILEYFNTANIIPSTISVTTSFLASNDIVLIILWTLASAYDIRYISVVVCFIAFLVNDIYGFVSWRKIKIRQQENI